MLQFWSPSLLGLASLAVASSFPHSDHHAPLVKRQAARGFQELVEGLRRRATPDFKGLNVSVAESPTANNVGSPLPFPSTCLRFVS